MLLNAIFLGIAFIMKLFLFGLLLFLAIKTKSKGVTLIAITQFFTTLLTLVSRLISTLFLSRGEWGGTDLYEIISIISSSIYMLSLIIVSFGVYLCYLEWKQGKFQPPPS